MNRTDIAAVRRQLRLCALFALALSAPHAFAQEGEATQEPPAEEADVETGRINGVVFDSETGEPILNVTVSEPRSRATTQTDLNGQFRLRDVPAGTVALSFFKPGYRAATVRDVEVQAGETTFNVSIQLQPRETSVAAEAQEGTGATAEGDAANTLVLDAIVVTAETVEGSDFALTSLRKQSIAATDSLSADTIARFGRSDVASAITLTPGVSISEGKYAVVRGLNERYSNTQFGGAVQPSSDPERQAVQLDLFPAGLVDSIQTQKTYTVDEPGDSTGGAIKLEPKKFPEERNIKVSFGIKMNDRAYNSDEYPDYETESDWELFAVGTRDRAAASSGARATEDFFLDTRDAPPGFSFSLEFGDTFLVDERDLGVVASFSYNSSYKLSTGSEFDRRSRPGGYRDPDTGVLIQTGDLARGILGDPLVAKLSPEELLELVGTEELNSGFAFGINSGSFNDFVLATEEVLIGGLLGLSYRVSPENLLSFNFFISQSGVDRMKNQTSRSRPGASQADGLEITKQTLYYQERNLTTLQLRGEHVLEDVNDLKIEWLLNRSRATQAEPDFRQTWAYREPDPRTPDRAGFYMFNGIGEGGGASANRYFSEVEEEQYNTNLDITYPFEIAGQSGSSFKVGISHLKSERALSQQFYGLGDFYREILGPGKFNRRRFETVDDIDAAIDELTAELEAEDSPRLNVFLPENDNDSQQSRRIFGAYGMFTLALGEKFKLTGGVRYERTLIKAEGTAVLGNTTVGQIYTNTQEFLGLRDDEIPDSFGANSRANTRLENGRLLPAVSAVYELYKAEDDAHTVNLRAGYSETLARPSSREISPYFSYNVAQDRFVIGNIGLDMSFIRNYDLRLEWFMRGTDLVAVSIFQKDVENPIEQVYLQSAQEAFLTWANNPNTARVRGVELELRKDLGFLWEPLAGLSVGGNFTYIEAEVGVPEIIRESRASRYASDPNEDLGDFPVINEEVPTTRRLFDQPEWILNLDLTYQNPTILDGLEVVVAAYAISDVLTAATGEFAFDEFDESYLELDFRVSQRFLDHWKLSFSVSNLLDPKREQIYDPDQTAIDYTRQSYRQGRDYSLSVSYDF